MRVLFFCTSALLKSLLIAIAPACTSLLLLAALKFCYEVSCNYVASNVCVSVFRTDRKNTREWDEVMNKVRRRRVGEVGVEL